MDINTIHHGDCLDMANLIDANSIDLFFADPPFNIKKSYSTYSDDLSDKRYLDWVEKWISIYLPKIKSTGSIYVCSGNEYQAEIKLILKKFGLIWRNDIIWHYSFGEQQKLKFSRCHTNIFYFVKSSEYCFNSDVIRVPSQRQLKYNDSRANPKGKIPDDVWWFGDVWKDSRICGTFNERLKHIAQMPEKLLARIIQASSKEGDLVLDPFCGSGTTAYMAQELSRNFITCDISLAYCKEAAKRIFKDEHRVKELVLEHAT